MERSTDAEKLVEDIRLRGGRAEAICSDVSVSTDVRRMMSQIEDSLGRVDILINNAGVAAGRESEITEADFDRTIATNLKSAFLCTQAVLPAMRARRWGRIVNISAMGARAGSLSVVYGASKAGLEGLTRAYALQLASCGVTVNAVAPGLIDTEMTRDLIETGSALARIPAGRAGTGDEIAQAVVFLIADSYITGQTVAINGGAFFS